MKRRLTDGTMVALFMAVVLALALTPASLVRAQGDDLTDGWKTYIIDYFGVEDRYVFDIDPDGDSDTAASKGSQTRWYEALAAPTDSWPSHLLDRSLDGAPME